MPETEDEVKDPPAKIATLWQKFHFSGRVIMCSVLFGLGLILIGGLIFAIKDDDASENEKDIEITNELPTKAPSNYVGPVVMGIGGFIVTVGVIMCLFETQVCRKKSGDTKPLISAKNDDVEAKVSESTAVPSSSHYHKNHKHKSRKASSSPRTTKSKHGKSHSSEQKQSSSKTPPISIDSKSFMTSSEDNFLTPPNTLDEHAALGLKNSREVEIQTSSSLMNSFTSSGTWNQSTEFLTPAASYKENSVSVDNSVELGEKQDRVNFKTNKLSTKEYTRPEYMTPMTTEEERIQNMFNQVKSEHMKIDEEQLEERESAVNLSPEQRNDYSVFNAENEVNKNINVSMNDRPLDVNLHTSTVKEATAEPTEAFDAFDKSKIDNEDNILSISNTSEEIFASVKIEDGHGSSDITSHTPKNENEDNIPTSHSTLEKTDSFLPQDSSITHVNESENEGNDENNVRADLESSASSEETLVSQDNSVEKPEGNDAEGLPIAGENSSDRSKTSDLSEPLKEETLVSQENFIEKPKGNDAQTILPIAGENSSTRSETPDLSESLKEDQSSPNHIMSDHLNSLTDTLKVEKVGTSYLSGDENDSEEIKNNNEQLIEKSS